MTKKEVKYLKCEECPSRSKGVFSSCEVESTERLNKNRITNIYKKGQTLFVEGNTTHGLYCIMEGAVKITRMGPEGKEVMVRLVSIGNILGHRSVFCSERYSATATALTDTTVCFVDKKFIVELIKKDSLLALNFIKNLSEDLGASEEKQASYTQKNVLERVCELLVLLKITYGEKVDFGWKLNLKLTREDMASYLGIATETLIRSISELKNEKIISQEGKNIIILDEAKMLKLGKID